MLKFFSITLIKLFFFLFFLLIIYYRSPYILSEGRFVAEEGYFWFRNSFIDGPFKGIIQVFWPSGYFNFWANLGSVFALLTPLEFAPLVTVYFSLTVIIYILIYILFSESEFLISLKDKILACFIILLSPPMVPEIWLNTLNSMSYFGIITILIYFQKNNSKNYLNKTSPLIILISSLSSLYTCIQTPFFIFKYLKNRNKVNFFNALFISLVSLFQAIIFLYSKINDLQNNVRFNISYEKFINYFYNVPLKSIFGREILQEFYKMYINPSHITFFLFAILFVFFLLIIFFLKEIKKDNILLALFLFFTAESILVFFGSWNHQVQGRYAVVPGVLFILIFLRISKFNKFFFNKLSLFLVIFSISIGAYEFKHKAKYKHFLDCNDCPVWKDEVIKWKKDKDYKLLIWNYPEKFMLLK